MPSEEIRKVGNNTFKVDLSNQVRELLADMREMTLTHVAAESPIAKRLFPSAYQNSPEMELDYQKLTHEPLAGHHQANLSKFEETLYNSELDEEEALAWIGALNNMRLILGTALQIEEDQPFPDENDPNYEGFVVYDLLTYLQGAFIEEIQR